MNARNCARVSAVMRQKERIDNQFNHLIKGGKRTVGKIKRRWVFGVVKTDH